VTTLETSDLPGGHATAAKITSSASGTSGAQLVLTVDEFKGRRIRVNGLFKGSGSTYAGNQRLQIYDGVNNSYVEVPNDATWRQLAIAVDIPTSATILQIRMIAGNDTTASLVLLATGVTVKSY